MQYVLLDRIIDYVDDHLTLGITNVSFVNVLIKKMKLQLKLLFLLLLLLVMLLNYY